MNAVQQTQRLIELGRADEALSVLQPLLATSKPAHALLAQQADALKVLGRWDEAVAVQERTVALYPASGIAWHNLAADLADVRRGSPARAAAEQALKLGVDAPETWLVLGNACIMLGDVDGAEKAYREALKRRPGYWQPAFALSRLTWMHTGDADAAIAPVKAVREAGKVELQLILVEAKILEAAGRAGEARALLDDVLARRPGDPHLLCVVAQSAFDAGDVEKAALLAERAVAALPQGVDQLVGLASIRLAQGRAEEALTLARRATEVSPLDQSAWGWLAIAARAANDPVCKQLYDYDAFVRAYRIDAPQGWPSLDAHLADLAATLRRLHVMRVAPADQSLRDGVQTPTDLTTCEEPAVRAFFQAIDAPMRRYMAEVGAGSDPLRSRNTGEYVASSAWSVLLKPNGFHTDHVHRSAWVSSAFYVETPTHALESERREGWIKFGQAPLPTIPPLPAEHFVKPEPGMLVLFPSYMWHGTVPFTSQERRLTIAFDALPR